MVSAGRRALVFVVLGAALVVGATLWTLHEDPPAFAAPRAAATSSLDAVDDVFGTPEPRAVERTAAEPDEAFWRELDASTKPTFEEKYSGLDAHVLALALARERVAAKLDAASAPVFGALFASGATTRVRTEPGGEPPQPAGSLVRRARPMGQPLDGTEFEVAEFDRAAQPETQALWAELTWLDTHVGLR